MALSLNLFLIFRIFWGLSKSINISKEKGIEIKALSSLLRRLSFGGGVRRVLKLLTLFRLSLFKLLNLNLLDLSLLLISITLLNGFPLRYHKWHTSDFS